MRKPNLHYKIMEKSDNQISPLLDFILYFIFGMICLASWFFIPWLINYLVK